MDRSRPLRLLVVGLTWPLETFLQRLLLGLTESGVEITVAGPVRPGGLQVRWIRTPRWQGSPATRLGQAALGATQAFLRSPSEARLVLGSGSAAISRHRIREVGRLAPLTGRQWDVLYFPWNSAAAAHLSMFRMGRPILVSCRGSQMNVAPFNPRRAGEVSRYLEALQKGAGVHVVSDALKRVIEKHGIDPGKIRVIRPAVDPNFFSPTGSDVRLGDPLRLVANGSLIWRKGYETLLLAVAGLIKNGIQASLRIVGEGPERERVAYTIADLGLTDTAEMLGRLTPEQVRDELQQADVFVLSSYSEGISNAALEAMSCGLPVVSTEVGGMGEAIQDGVEGLLVPPRDPKAIGEAITRLVADPELRIEMGRAARDRVLEQFSLKQQIAAWKDWLHSVVDQHRARAAS